MQWANAGVAQVAEHHLARYACRDHLIVDQIRRHPNQRQVAQVLANDLMSSGKTDEGSKAFYGNRHPVMDILGDRLFQRESFICHIRLAFTTRVAMPTHVDMLTSLHHFTTVR